MPRTFWLAVLCTTCFLGGLSGCGQSGDPAQTQAHRQRLLLPDEPADALGALDIRDTHSAQLNSGVPVVLVGRIGGTNDPWVAGHASFVVVDPSAAVAAGHQHDHACGADCPFCSKKQPENEALAIVNLIDPQGQVVPIDARQLLDLEANQMVVVRGQARVDELGYLVVSADGIYVRR